MVEQIGLGYWVIGSKCKSRIEHIFSYVGTLYGNELEKKVNKNDCILFYDGVAKEGVGPVAASFFSQGSGGYAGEWSDKILSHRDLVDSATRDFYMGYSTWPSKC